mmetsp:Transcript_15946/g.28267  ORF Transcript_15946/g.28267 Transcript_15946/m.28267 type:complete len:243 (-) Transcript_15946:728-1456(-)
MLHQPFSLGQDHLRHLYVTLRVLVKSGADHLPSHGPLHLCYFLGALIDQQHDQVNVRVVHSDAVGDSLQNGGLARPGGGHDQCALAQPNGGSQVDDAAHMIIWVVECLQLHPPVREQRRQVLKNRLPGSNLWVFIVDLFDTQYCEVLFEGLRGADVAGHCVPSAQVVQPQLGGGYVDVVGTCEVVGVLHPEETRAILELLHHPLRQDLPVPFVVRLEHSHGQFTHWHLLRIRNVNLELLCSC